MYFPLIFLVPPLKLSPIIHHLLQKTFPDSSSRPELGTLPVFLSTLFSTFPHWIVSVYLLSICIVSSFRTQYGILPLHSDQLADWNHSCITPWVVEHEKSSLLVIGTTWLSLDLVSLRVSLQGPTPLTLYGLQSVNTELFGWAWLGRQTDPKNKFTA